jgi:ABC-type transport system involved in multi-copper enzyme maturation permease subunit
MTETTATSSPWVIRRTQLRAVLRIELKKTLFGRRAISMYLLAALPIPLFAVMAVVPLEAWREHGIGQASKIYGIVYQTFMLRAVIFFGCVGLFTSLFRGEVLDRSLHYYFLAPVRREVLVVGKYLSGLLTTSIVFTGMVLTTYLLLYVPFGSAAAIEYLLRGPGLGHLAAYLGVTLLACLGYGSVFLILGLVFRNPILPGAVVLFWELINFLLPPALKRISVIHYLKGLLPLPMAEGPFAVLSDPPSVWASVAGLLLFSAVVLTLSARRIRRMEISYAD